MPVAPTMQRSAMRPVDLPMPVADGTVADRAVAMPLATPSPWPIFCVSSIAVFLVSLDTTMLYAAFGSIRSGFPGATAADMSWVLNAYTVVYAAMLIPAGGLADTHGRKKVFLSGVALFLAASTACGLSSSVGWLIGARVAQAVGAALLTPASLSMVLAAFPQGRRAVAVSLWGAVGALAAAIGPSLGSFVVAGVGWPWAFFINLPLGALSIWKGIAILEEARLPDGSKRHVDLVGMALLIVAVGAIALSIVQLESPAWTRSELLGAAAAGLAALGGFIAWARIAKAPLVHLDLFRNTTYSVVNLATFSFGMAFSMMFFAFFFYMRGIWHYTLPQAGLAITPGPLLVMPVAIVSGRLATRFGHRPLLVGGALLYACSGLWFLIVPGIEPRYLTQWLPGLLMSGVAVGMTLPSLSAAAVDRLPADQYAVGSAVNQATRQIGSVLGVALTVLLLAHDGLRRGDFTTLYGIHATLGLLTALLCLPVDTRPIRVEAPASEEVRDPRRVASNA